MKKIILLTIIALSVIFNPIQVKAEEIPLRDIYDTTAITVDNINIIPQFVNNIETSTQSFGISGTIINTKLEPVIVKSETKYYDNNNQQVASSTIRQTIKEQSSVVYNNITDIKIAFIIVCFSTIFIFLFFNFLKLQIIPSAKK